jgi:CBS domain-containing protein
MSGENSNPTSTPVKDIMKKTLIFVNPTTTAFQIAKMMEQGGISAIFVKDKETFVGIVTDRDFATKIAVNHLSFDTPAEKIMTSPLITINQNEPISAAAELMTNKKIRKLAVLDNNDIVGILRSIDLVKYLVK